MWKQLQALWTRKRAFSVIVQLYRLIVCSASCSYLPNLRWQPSSEWHYRVIVNKVLLCTLQQTSLLADRRGGMSWARLILQILRLFWSRDWQYLLSIPWPCNNIMLLESLEKCWYKDADWSQCCYDHVCVYDSNFLFDREIIWWLIKI